MNHECRKDIMKTIEAEIRPQLLRAQEVLEIQIMKTFPEIAHSVNTQRSEFFVLKNLINYTEEQKHAGLIADKYAAQILSEYHDKLGFLKMRTP